MKTLIFLFLLVCQSVSFAINETDSKTTTSENKLHLMIENNKYLQSKIALIEDNNIALNAQNEILKHSVNEVRTAYFWALSVIGAIIILFLSINFYLFGNPPEKK